jgi:hypothetical protein
MAILLTVLIVIAAFILLGIIFKFCSFILKIIGGIIVLVIAIVGVILVFTFITPIFIF